MQIRKNRKIPFIPPEERCKLNEGSDNEFKITQSYSYFLLGVIVGAALITAIVLIIL